MKQVMIIEHGDQDVLRVTQGVDPKPAKDELVIDVKAIGVNFADILARKGLYPDAPKPPCVVGYEVSGIVVKSGNGKSPLEGKRVLALTRFGGYSDKICVPAAAVFELPEELTFEQGAGLPVNYLTAYQLLIVMGALRKGDSVLIHNAGGGVGLAALDIARNIGAITYGTASARKHDFLNKRGLHKVIDYTKKDFYKEIKKLTKGQGVELVIDPVGGKNWKKSYKLLRSTGRMGMFGISTVAEDRKGKVVSFLKLLARMPLYNPVSLMNANKGVFGVNLGHMWHEAGKVYEWMLIILNGVEEGWVRPHVDKTFPMEQAGQAHAYLEERKNIGKVILTTE